MVLASFLAAPPPEWRGHRLGSREALARPSIQISRIRWRTRGPAGSTADSGNYFCIVPLDGLVRGGTVPTFFLLVATKAVSGPTPQGPRTSSNDNLAMRIVICSARAASLPASAFQLGPAGVSPLTAAAGVVAGGRSDASFGVAHEPSPRYGRVGSTLFHPSALFSTPRACCLPTSRART